MYTLNGDKTRLNINNFPIDIDDIDYIAMEKMKDCAYEGYCVVFHRKAGKGKTYFKESNSKNGLATYDNFRALADLLTGEGMPFVEISGVRLINAEKVSSISEYQDNHRNCKNMKIDFCGREADFVGVREKDIALLREYQQHREHQNAQ